MKKMWILPAMLFALAFPKSGAALENSLVKSGLDAKPHSGPAPAAVFQLSGFGFNSAMLINLANDAQQTNGVITSYNAGPNAGVVSVTIMNTGTAPGYCYFIPILNQVIGTFACPGNMLVQGPVIQTTTMIEPGQTLVANLNNLEVVSPQPEGYNGTVCTAVQNDFQGGDIGTVANAVLKMQFLACLQLTDATGTADFGKTCNEAPIMAFTQPPAGATSCPALISPHNNIVPNALPAFDWTPAFQNGSTANIKYQLVISETESGAPWASIDVPPGQTYYQWQASDRAFEAGKTYYYHVISKQADTGTPVGGQNGTGWNTQKWFNIAGAANSNENTTGINGMDIMNFYQANAPAAVKNATMGMGLGAVDPTTLSNPDVVFLVTHPNEIQSFSVVRQ